MRHDTAGDPISGIKWTRRTPGKIAGELQKLNIHVEVDTVARLLRSMGYSLRANRKYLESGNKNPPSKEIRNQQFEFIGELRDRFTFEGHAIISVDSKKRELVGNFKNRGATYVQEADAVFDHDFPSDARGVALPYGVYDIRRNHGSIYVGTSHDTAEFAVDNIKRWWLQIGQKCYRHPHPKLLILADCGGSNGARLRLWKARLEASLCDCCNLSVTVSHYPPGASKYNPIEHRLLCEISKNWAGCPLRNYDTILNHIRTTKTKSGLRVRAKLITKHYKTGLRISDKEFKQLRFEPADILPKWNYSIATRN